MQAARVIYMYSCTENEVSVLKVHPYPDSSTYIGSQPTELAISYSMRDVAIFLTYNVPGSMPCTILYSE